MGAAGGKGGRSGAGITGGDHGGAGDRTDGPGGAGGHPPPGGPGGSPAAEGGADEPWDPTLSFNCPEKAAERKAEAIRSGEPKGQWTDGRAATRFLSSFRQTLTHPEIVSLPAGLAVVHLPDGTTIPATHALIFPTSTTGVPVTDAHPLAPGKMRVSQTTDEPLRWGTTFTEHGNHRTETLKAKARTTGIAQGQWLDHAQVERFFADLRGWAVAGEEGITVSIPEGMAVMHLPDGTMRPATRAHVVPLNNFGPPPHGYGYRELRPVMHL